MGGSSVKAKRHPVAWPAMKIRGHRRRALAAARRTFVTVVPFARVSVSANGEVTAFALSRFEPGAMRLEHKVTVDGFGRSVKEGRR